MDIKIAFNIINKYLSLIIIVPAILGGLWQVIELSRISFSFIRFFSVSQIVPDGLLILLFLLILFFSLVSLIWIIEKYNKGYDSDDDDLEDSNIYYAIMFCLLFLASIVAVIYFNNYVANDIENIFSILIYLPINIIISLLAYGFLKEFVFHSIKKLSARYLQSIVSVIWFIFLSVQSVMLFVLLDKFHDVFMLPKELNNVDNLKCNAEKIYDTNDFEILYVNDKYIFTECHKFSKDWKGNPTQSEIRIFKFDELFDNNACIGNKRIRDEFVKDSIKDSKKPKFIK